MFRLPNDAGAAKKSGSGIEKGGENRFFKSQVFRNEKIWEIFKKELANRNEIFTVSPPLTEVALERESAEVWRRRKAGSLVEGSWKKKIRKSSKKDLKRKRRSERSTFPSIEKAPDKTDAVINEAIKGSSS